MTIKFLPFSECSPSQIADAFALRQRVFIIEQQCFYEDIDGADPQASHLFLYDGETLAAYLRYFAPGTRYSEASLGRITVEKKYRGGDAGRKLIKTGITKALKCHPKAGIRIEAQAALTDYYTKYGFKPSSEVYVVDGIDHIQMVLR